MSGGKVPPQQIFTRYRALKCILGWLARLNQKCKAGRSAASGSVGLRMGHKARCSVQGALCRVLQGGRRERAKKLRPDRDQGAQ